MYLMKAWKHKIYLNFTDISYSQKTRTISHCIANMGLLPDTSNCGLRMRRECTERFPRHQYQRKSLVSDPGMHNGTCVTHVPWCMSGSLIRGGGENVPGIPGACATRNFTYLARSPAADMSPCYLLSRSKTQMSSKNRIFVWVRYFVCYPLKFHTKYLKVEMCILYTGENLRELIHVKARKHFYPPPQVKI